MDIKIEDYKEGVEIAEQIASVMQSKSATDDIEQYKKLKEWLETNPYSGNIAKRLGSEDIFEDLASNFNRADCETEVSRLIIEINKKRRASHLRKITKISLSTAAAIALFSFIVYQQFTNKMEGEQFVAANTTTTGTITEHPKKPTLILSDGKNIDLTTIENNIETDHFTVLKKGKNQLNYNNKKSASSEISYNTLIVPKQFTYNVVLEDGTIVYLNAGSELYYPTKFTKEKREVFLKGEGYFDVKKSTIPFIVSVGKMQIKVYGTKFNINSYNSSHLKTVLIEGLVGVSMQNSNLAEVLLQPNQMYTVDSVGKGALSNVDVSQYTSWMDGFIKGKNETLADLLNSVAKWYGVEFIYSEEIKNIPIEASLNNKRPIEEVIKSIELIVNKKIITKEENKYMIL